MNNNYVVIMAGGIGSRFWPISRSVYPKQFIDVLGIGRTLIQATYDRFVKLVPKEHIYVVTNDQHIETVRKQLPGIDSSNILGEPIMRNTAPCVAYASHKIYQLNSEAIIIVTPADHLILETQKFNEAIQKSLTKACENDWLITLGVLPTRPDTGYGYIQYIGERTDFKKVKTFTEKPNIELAEIFIKSGDFLWNAGVFIWSAQAIIKAFERYQPEMNDLFKEGDEELYNTSLEKAFINTAYLRCINISIDFAVMEKANNVYVLPVDFGWSDLGTWASVYEHTPKDAYLNAIQTTNKVLLKNSSNCIVNVPNEKLVVLSGLDNYVIIDSNDTLLICPRDEEQQVKKIISEVKSKYGKKYI
ncbi:mannose-1-phosphate guanylyltransferase [Olivibacter sp. SDN3]|uniref:mannose-1-phosphate guanylyltransferase n=1 Tax=Olivibacter sp. SDN3 TaxID=2764720 RepID=UPI001651791D|nr:mannose-1-phosphate guanylyltransferase [Olivibacter sp. SDN3]QNL48581.1 mannose-1-phosphate guanylyltransferase [Olivibacter sp. SDN3]